MIELSASALTETSDPTDLIPHVLIESVNNHFLLSDLYNKPTDRFFREVHYGQVEINWDEKDILNTEIILYIKDD